MGWLFPRRTNKRERRSTVSEIIVPVTSPDPLGGMQPEMAGQNNHTLVLTPAFWPWMGFQNLKEAKSVELELSGQV